MQGDSCKSRKRDHLKFWNTKPLKKLPIILSYHHNPDYYEMKVYILPKLIHWNLTSCDGIRRWDFGICWIQWGHEDGPVMTGIRTLLIMTKGACSLCLASNHMRKIRWESAVYNQEKHSHQIWQCWHPDHGFADLRT